MSRQRNYNYDEVVNAVRVLGNFVEVARMFDTVPATIQSIWNTSTGEPLAKARQEKWRRELTKLRVEEGYSVEEIAEILNVHKDTVFYRLRKLGIKRSDTKTKAKYEQWRTEIQRLLDCGFTKEQIGKALGITGEAVQYRMRKAGLK